ncbi:MAG: PEP/pyruvate-binding domain-containing protein, partial [Candidatus Acidiferrales bacterium]
MNAPSSGIAVPSELVLNLAQVDSSMLPIVGGKAANLGELIQAGLPVPPGFCVTTEAYRQVAASANIDFDALAAVGSKGPAGSGPFPPSDHAGGNGVEALALRAREALLGVDMPRAISRAVVESYQSLGENVPVAVRSSATAEDLPFASFAGQQDTYLQIIGTEAVIGAVRHCWASLWTERAVVYRTNNGIDHRAVRLAVVVQRMVDAKVAGVLFTANPITDHRRQAVLDANPGLGEAVVSGAVNPDHFVVDTDGKQILDRRLGDKRVEVRSLPGGGTERVEKSADADRACLTDDQILALAELGDRVEKHFGAPQDIEWAIDSAGKLWLTQSRPITTLFPLPKPRVALAAKPGEENLRAYFCFSLAQGLTRPITPMGLAGFRLLASAVARLLGFAVEDAFD